MDFGGEAIGRVDAKTGQASLYPRRQALAATTHDDGRARPHLVRRVCREQGGDVRPEGRDFKEGRRPRRTPIPTTSSSTGTASCGADRCRATASCASIPGTGASLEYLLPRPTNVRRVFVDNSTTPVTFWVGSNHGASIVKLRPLD